MSQLHLSFEQWLSQCYWKHRGFFLKKYVMLVNPFSVASDAAFVFLNKTCLHTNSYLQRRLFKFETIDKYEKLLCPDAALVCKTKLTTEVAEM